MDYKNTLNMPITDFEMKANLKTKEPVYQQNWIKKGIYKKLLEQNKGKPLFLLHDGPPYANGNLHCGHALNKILKDFIIRYKNFSGFYSPYIPGWDTHGLPIEVAMLKTNPEARTDSISKRRERCREYALSQVNNQKEQFLKMGLLSDFNQKYLTLDHDFEIEQIKTFANMVSKNLIFYDLKPVYWSWSSQTSLADAEIEYGDVESDSIYFSVNIEDEKYKGIKLLVWTTTPWTLPANLAIAVHPNFDYVVIEFKKNKFIIAKDLVEKITQKFNIDNYKILDEFKGLKLENIKYQHPYLNKNNPIILAEYVSNLDGTGLVHNAPGFGLDDYLACKKYNIDIFCPIDDYGKFTADVNDFELEGLLYINANPIIIKRLIEKNNLFHQEKIIHSVAHDWRTKKPVIYRATKQWFVNLNPIKDKIIKTLNNDVKSPNQKNTNRMIEMIRKRDEWCISRQRAWGVPLPIIYFNEKPIMDIDLINNIIDILNKKGTNAWFELDVNEFLTSKYINKDGEFRKEKDIMDVWFDSGSSSNMFKLWGLNYPCDLYLEGSDQYRGWFNSSLIIGTINNNISPYKGILQHGFVLDEKGYKMSKSKNNTIDPLKMFDIYGTDVFRIWVANSEYQDDLRIGENILKQQAEVYRKIRNTLFRFTLSNLFDFDFSKHKKEIKNIVNIYVLHRLNIVLNEIDNAYKKYNFIDAMKNIYNFTIELSSWYFEYIKDPLYCYSLEDSFRREIQTTLFIILKNLLIASAPIIPHTAEEVYEHLNMVNKKESIHLENWIDLDPFVKINNELMDEFNEFFKLKDIISLELEKARQKKDIKKNNEAFVKINIEYKNKFNHLKNLKEFLMVADVEFTNLENICEVLNAEYPKCLRCWAHKPQSDMVGEVCYLCNKIIHDNE